MNSCAAFQRLKLLQLLFTKKLLFKFMEKTDIYIYIYLIVMKLFVKRMNNSKERREKK
jgi:hypothetical protein